MDSPSLDPEHEVVCTRGSLAPVCLPYLPAEVKSLVAHRLHKSELKSLRYVSRQWYEAATPPLFDRIFVSPWNKDLEVFKNITRHPFLRHSIKELICDASTIPDMRPRKYLKSLYSEIHSMTVWLDSDHPFKSPDARLEQLVNYVVGRKRSKEEFFREYCTDDFVNDALRKWLKLAAEETASLDSGRQGPLFLALCSGIRRLPNLQSVIIEDDMWDRSRRESSAALQPYIHPNPYHSLDVIRSGSPLVRTWHPWHTRPRRLQNQLGDGGDQLFNRVDILLQAISRTDAKIKRFSCYPISENGLSPRSFMGTNDIPYHLDVAFYRLQDLSLKITPLSDVDVVDHGQFDILGYLPKLLGQMTDLKCLGLNLNNDERLWQRRNLSVALLDDTCYTKDQVFGDGIIIWPKLEQLYIAGLALNALDLFALIFIQMPTLQRLWLYRIDLLEDHWASAVEVMRERAMILPWKLLSLQGLFRHKDRESWPCVPDEGSIEHSMLQQYTNYIEDGGRHPSLPPDYENSFSNEYLREMLENSRKIRHGRNFTE